jgi:oligopeptide transport system substrate-binding protein
VLPYGTTLDAGREARTLNPMRLQEALLTQLPRGIRIAAFRWCIVAAILTGCTRSDSASTTDAGTRAQVLRISQRNEPADLDPAKVTLPDEFFILRALSEGLLIPSPDGGPPQPAAAERFEVSTDGLTYTFQLRPDGRWSNGEPVTAADFVESYRRLLTPGTAAPKADLFFAVRNARAFATGEIDDFPAVGFAAPNSHTLIITLARPTPRFANYVASGPWIPVNPRTLAQHGRTWTRPGRFVGNGPFVLAEWRPQQRIVVKKNPRYYDADRVALDEIHFIRFDSGDTEERAYRAGQIDVSMAVPTTKLEPYARDRPSELHRAPVAETRYLSFNTRRGPLADVRVRRALALAIDRKKLVDRVLLGGQEPTGRFLPPALRYHRDRAPFDAEQRYAPAEARQLLAEAGFAGGIDFPKLELTGWAQTPVLEAIQAMWRLELGVDVGIAVREARVHLEALRAGVYDIAFITSIPDVADPADMLGNFLGSSVNNYPQWRSPRYDALYVAATERPDTASQAKAFAALESELLQAAPVAPLYFNSRNWLMSPRVRGWREDALWTRFYRGVHLASD